MAGFKLDKLPHESVELGVRYFGIVFDVVETLVAAYLFTKPVDLEFYIFRHVVKA